MNKQPPGYRLVRRPSRPAGAPRLDEAQRRVVRHAGRPPLVLAGPGPALVTRGFAEELRDLLLRAAERGLDGRSLSRLGTRAGRDEWVAAGRFLDRYAARFDLAPVPAYDYAEIVRIAARLLGRA